jgi:hypothetical protein
VQGAGATSPLLDTTITVEGVITANAADAFYIQTEAGFEDGDPDTSEGLAIATWAEFGVGTVVHVTGTVEEFGDAGAGTVTRLGPGSLVVPVRMAAGVPDEFPLTAVELSPSGSPSQLERFEGMRVSAALRSVSSIGLDGSFFAVLAGGMARPFREAGIDAGSPLSCAISPCQFDVFDGNPERLRVDADGLGGTMAPLLLPANSPVTDVDGNVTVVGVLHFDSGAYTLLPEMSLSAGDLTVSPAPAAGAAEFSVASLNLGELGAEGEVELQHGKASVLVRTVLNAPDVIAVQRADAAGLEALAARIDADASAGGEQEPGYVAHVGGFLVRASRVTVESASVVGADELFETAPLFDRAPAMLLAVVNGGTDHSPQPLTVLNSELRPLTDVERADEAGAAARAHRRAQAEWLAQFVDSRQDTTASEKLVWLGNFNAHEFNDGYLDVMGTVSGHPAPGDQVVLDSPDLVSRDLENLAGLLPEDVRYSSVGRGNAQLLDHTLVSANLTAQVRGFVLARVNADFSEVWRYFGDDPRRLSDRDPSVAYFAFASDVTPPQFDAAPQDVQAEATGPQGAAVGYAVPTATDDVDGPVAVTCAPASGSPFALGTTSVRCASADAAGNQAEVFFAVTVHDTTAPVFPSTPADLEIAANGPNGAVVTFGLPVATDAVDANVTVTCEPASGSLFPIGNTAVACTAVDDTGNVAVTGFTVTVTAQTSMPGRMSGNGELLGQTRVKFAFDVKETRTQVDRGWLVVHIENRNGRNDRYLAGVVTGAVFTNSPAYNAGAGPANGVDTVVFSGVGWWNGRGGHTFEITASDRGEPGRGLDTFTVVVKRNGRVVDSATGTLHKGNIQSRRR